MLKPFVIITISGTWLRRVLLVVPLSWAPAGNGEPEEEVDMKEQLEVNVDI